MKLLLPTLFLAALFVAWQVARDLPASKASTPLASHAPGVPNPEAQGHPLAQLSSDDDRDPRTELPSGIDLLEPLGPTEEDHAEALPDQPEPELEELESPTQKPVRLRNLEMVAQDRAPSVDGTRWESATVELPSGDIAPHGPWFSFHANGGVEERGAYDMGKESGTWEWWYENGNKQAIGLFDDGRRIGDWTWWHENGNVLMRGQYQNGEGAGSWTMYHENGEVWGTGQYVGGEISGPWTFWTAEGQLDLERTGTYEFGERVGD